MKDWFVCLWLEIRIWFRLQLYFETWKPRYYHKTLWDRYELHHLAKKHGFKKFMKYAEWKDLEEADKKNGF